MAKEDDAGTYGGNLTEAEHGLAQIIATIPEIAGFIEANTLTGTLPVFAISDESAKTFINKNVSGALKQAVLVEFTECSDVRVSSLQNYVYGLCSFRVSVSSPGLLANSAPYNTQTILAAIMQTLTGAQLGAPFVDGLPVKLASVSREVFDDGAITSQATFQIFTELFKLTTV